jgi:hypothetical protein
LSKSLETDWRLVPYDWFLTTGSLASLRLPDTLDPSDYHLHPTQLDACFQTLLGAVYLAETITIILSRAYVLRFTVYVLRVTDCITGTKRF